MENPFGVLNSETKRRQYFTGKWGRVDPVEYVLGTRFDTLCNRTTGAYDQVVVTDKFVYIPIVKTLQFIYKHPNIKEIMRTDFSSREIFLMTGAMEIFSFHFIQHRVNYHHVE